MASQQQTSTTPEADRDRWRTPAWLFAFLSARFGPFGIDLAADETNALCEEFFTREDDALSQSWAGLNCFANPPFSSPSPWVEKAVIEADLGASTTLILPAHRNERWASLARRATERIEFEGRVNYLRPDGVQQNGNSGGTQVLHFRAYDLGYTRTVWVKTRELMERYG